MNDSHDVQYNNYRGTGVAADCIEFGIINLAGP